MENGTTVVKYHEILHYLTTFSPEAVASTCFPAHIIWLFAGCPLTFTLKKTLRDY